ncbi:hypothetical protein SAMN05880582_1126 [Rhizobium sp. RU20A]|nr:hypothetical protein SAMN05880582_1126 [Rhizobium sp. RU20A]
MRPCRASGTRRFGASPNRDMIAKFDAFSGDAVTFSTVALVAYSLIALVFLHNTFQEGHVRERAWDWERVAGLALCLAWPLILLGIVVLARLGRVRIDEAR